MVGTSGSGKTTLARALSERLGVPHTELDGLHWRADWNEAPDDEMRAAIIGAVAGDGWVIDGNYSRFQPLILARADTLVWLDFPLWVNLWRLTRRTGRRITTREPLWEGCRETWKTTLSRDSIFVWLFKTYRKNRVKYAQLGQSPECAHLDFVRLRSPRAADRFLEDVKVSATYPQPADEFPAASAAMHP